MVYLPNFGEDLLFKSEQGVDGSKQIQFFVWDKSVFCR